MADAQYDVSPEKRRLLEDQARRRAVLRAEFLKQVSNPHIHATSEAGGVFDAGLQRFIAMKGTGYNHFKPSPKTTALGMAMIGVPILGYAYLLNYVRNKQEHKYRTGQVAYKDRSFKFC